MDGCTACRDIKHFGLHIITTLYFIYIYIYIVDPLKRSAAVDYNARLARISREMTTVVESVKINESIQTPTFDSVNIHTPELGNIGKTAPRVISHITHLEYIPEVTDSARFSQSVWWDSCDSWYMIASSSHADILTIRIYIVWGNIVFFNKIPMNNITLTLYQIYRENKTQTDHQRNVKILNELFIILIYN